MITAEFTQQVDADAWNARVRQFAGGSIFQTTYWASYFSAYLGARPHYLILREANEIVGQLLMLEMLRGHESFLGNVTSLVGSLGAPLLRVLTWREGPLLAESSHQAEILLASLQGIERLAIDRVITGIDEASLPIGQSSNGLKAMLLAGGFQSHQRATVRIDVRPPLEHLWAGLKQGVARTPVRKSAKQGLALQHVNSLEDLREFYQLVTEWRKEEGFPSYRFERYKEMFMNMRSHCEFFLVKQAECVAAGAGLIHFNGQAHILTPVMSSVARRERVYAGDFLYWEMIQWCHENGFSVFDLQGIATTPSSNKETGIRRFKEKWGGQVIEYPVFSAVLKPGRWRFVSGLQNVKHAIRRWRHGN